MPFYYWTSKRTRNKKLGHLGQKIEVSELHVSAYFLLHEVEFRSNYNYHFMLLIILACYLHFEKLPLELMLSMWHVYLRFVGLFVGFFFFHGKTWIKMICLFLGIWQEANTLYFPGQKAENFVKIALMSWFQSKNWHFQQIFGVVTFSLSMGIHLKSGQTTNSWRTTVWPPKVSSS